MNEKNGERAARRRLLKALGSGVGLASAGTVVPRVWTRPVVDSVMLPAHAQVSGEWYDTIDLFAALVPQRPGLFERLAGLFPTARADLGSIGSGAAVCIKRSGGDYIADFFLKIVPYGSWLFSNTLQSNSVFVDLPVIESGAGCPKNVYSIQAKIDSVGSEAAGQLKIQGIEFDFSLPMQACNLPSLDPCIPGP